MPTRAMMLWTTSTKGHRADTQALHAPWGDPAHKLPPLIDYLAACAALQASPRPAGYRNYADLSPQGDFFRQQQDPNSPLPADLDFLYEVTVVDNAPDWACHVTVHGRRLLLGADLGTPVGHQFRMTSSNAAQGHAEAARLLRRRVEALCDAGETADAWAVQREAQRHELLAR